MRFEMKFVGVMLLAALSWPVLTADTAIQDLLSSKLSELYEASSLWNDPDVCAEIEPVITRKGYGFERHNVTTEDGYVIQIHRIPTGLKPCSNETKPVVFLMVGLLQDSVSYVLDFPTQCAGFYLADNCYDVWLGNFRGTTVYGRKHVDPAFEKSDAFWNFTFHEYGVYDMPAEIDYVLNKTGMDKLFYVGLSQGGSAFLVMMSERPQYNSKIKAVTLLAPMYNLAHVRLPTLTATLTVLEPPLTALYLAGVHELLPKFSAVSVLASVLCRDPASVLCALAFDLALNFKSEHVNKLKAVTLLAPMYNLAHVRLPTLAATLTVLGPPLTTLYLAGVRELLPKFSAVSVLASILCRNPASVLCALAFDLALNFESKYVNKTRLPVYTCQYPAGTSTKNLIHTDQVFKAKRFQTFDSKFIMPLSSSYHPPRPYNVSNTNVDVGIIYSTSDEIATVTDTRTLIRDLGSNVKFTHLIKDDSFGHFNYASAAYVLEEFVLDPLNEFFSRYK